MKRSLARAIASLTVIVALLGAVVASATATPVPIEPDGYTPPKLKIAIVYSQTTLDWLKDRGTPSKYPHAGKERALLYYLQHRGYNVTQIVGDRDITDTNLAKYDVVVFNSMYGLGYAASEAVARYVAGGGGLVATIGSPRVNPEAKPDGKADGNLREWWWRQFHEKGGNHLWEWGPLSSLYHEAFVNDGAYTPEYTLKPNPSSPIIQQAQAILSARGLDSSIAGITLHHPGANLEMSLKVPGATDCTSAADFNLLTPSVKRLYPKAYTAIMSSLYGAGRTVKFDYGATDYLSNWDSKLYTPKSPNGYAQGEVAGALVEAAIVWAASPDGTVATSVAGSSYATVNAGSSKTTIKQTVTNSGSALTRATVRLTLLSPSGKTLKSWVTRDLTFTPHQTRTFTYSYGKLPAGACKVGASFTYGYPSTTRVAKTTALVARGQKVRTQ